MKPIHILLALVVLALSSPALAQSADASGDLGMFRDWKAYKFIQDGKRICFIYSEPKSSEPSNVRRGDIYIQITHRPDAKIEDEVSYTAGYPFKANRNAAVRIGSRDWKLFTQGESAWTRTPDEDSRLVRAMIKGEWMEIRGTSTRGTETVDIFSLSGFTAAYKEASKACGISR